MVKSAWIKQDCRSLSEANEKKQKKRVLFFFYFELVLYLSGGVESDEKTGRVLGTVKRWIKMAQRYIKLS